MRWPIVFLMYHELKLPGRRLCQHNPGYVRYVVGAAEFQTQMQLLHTGDWRGLNVSQALGFPSRPGVAITFDDGCETDLLAAAPVLLELGFGATFYITAGFLGNRGFLRRGQLQELSKLGFEIGCHSLTHPHLTDLDDPGLRREMLGAKQQLEDILGRPIEHFSCPGGRCNQRVAGAAREAGYRSLATSRARANRASSDPYGLGRIAVLRSMPALAVQELARGEGLWSLNLRNAMQNSAKAVLGNSLYDRFRESVLQGLSTL